MATCLPNPKALPPLMPPPTSFCKARHPSPHVTNSPGVTQALTYYSRFLRGSFPFPFYGRYLGPTEREVKRSVWLSFILSWRCEPLLPELSWSLLSRVIPHPDACRRLGAVPATGVTSPLRLLILTCHTFYTFSFWRRGLLRTSSPMTGWGTM